MARRNPSTPYSYGNLPDYVNPIVNEFVEKDSARAPMGQDLGQSAGGTRTALVQLAVAHLNFQHKRTSANMEALKEANELIGIKGLTESASHMIEEIDQAQRDHGPRR